MLSVEQIIDLIERRRLLLRDIMNENIRLKREKAHDHIGVVAEYISLEVLLLAIKEAKPYVWNVAPATISYEEDKNEAI